MKTVIEVVAGVEGSSLYINGYRVAGPKPWGGGRVIESWETDEIAVFNDHGILKNTSSSKKKARR